MDWGAGYMPRGRAEISEECRQAFTAACHLLLECTTFPLYLSEEESQVLYSDMFHHTGNSIHFYTIMVVYPYRSVYTALHKLTVVS